MANMNLEKALEKLEKIVEELEIGEHSLEKSIKKFEEGMKLSAFCTQKLDETEKKIMQLTRGSDGKLNEVSLDQDGDE